MSLDIARLTLWNKTNSSNPVHKLASTVLQNYNADDLLLNKTRLQQLNNNRVFNTKISTVPSPITNQRSSGRCWLFAGTNELRINVMKQLNLKEFELSQSYLFFYDKLEKCNYFLDQIIKTRDEPVESRLVQYLLTAPTQDGGQYSMFWNIIAKYGIIPKDLYDDSSFSTTASRKWNALLTTKLREMAQGLRDVDDDPSQIDELRSIYQEEIFKMITMFMDMPPMSPNQNFKWQYQDKDKNIHTIESTPLQFAEKYCGINWGTPPVSLINDPRHEYGKLIKIDKLGNVIGGNEVIYLNVDNKTLSKLIITRLQRDKPVFFGSHTPKYMDKKNGIMDLKLWDYNAIDYNLSQDKANRIKYNESLMTHAMLITGCHVQSNDGGDDEIPTRYCVENSWGKDSGKDGLYLMTQEYFEEYCYQIVVDLQDLPTDLAQKFTDTKEEPIILPIWDPMGALASI